MFVRSRSAFFPSRTKSSSFRIWAAKSFTIPLGLYTRESGIACSSRVASDSRMRRSISMIASIPGRCTFRATGVPSFSHAR